MTGQRDNWTGRAGFIAATIGSAVGLGSIWKFPYEVGANGGSAFLLFYGLGLVLIVVPLLFAEFAIGRRGGGDPAISIGAIAAARGAGRGWALAGTAGVVTGFLILSYYAVIGGWTLGYVFDTVRSGLPDAVPGAAQRRFDAFLASPWRLGVFHAIFMIATALVVARGVVSGIETASKVLMPLLAVLMVLLAVYAMAVGDLRRTADFLLRLDPAHLTARAALDALGLGFFSIGVGLGLMITYAAYGGASIDLKQVALVSVAGDTAVSLLAGLAVFPIVFANGLDPAGGPGLVFVTLPLAFARMPLGVVAAVAFFLLLFVAALASAISMLELAVALVTRRLGWSRGRASAIVAAACFVAGVASNLSFNLWAHWHPLGAVSAFRDSTVFDLLDFATSDVLLPACGFALALFAGWVVPLEALAGELRLGPVAARVLQTGLRYLVPGAIAATALAPLVA